MSRFFVFWGRGRSQNLNLLLVFPQLFFVPRAPNKESVEQRLGFVSLRGGNLQNLTVLVPRSFLRGGELGSTITKPLVGLALVFG